MRFFVLLFAVIFFSCSNPLQKSYNPIFLEEDVIELKKKISDDELNKLLEYIRLSSYLGVDILGKTYNDLLNEVRAAEINEKIIDNSILTQNVQELLNERLDRHKCDDFIIELHSKRMHKDDNDSVIWYDDSYLIDY